MSLRARLRALILLTLLPIALFGLAGAYFLVQKERETLERGMSGRLSALMTGIDAQLYASITPLELLARSPSLARDDLAAFRLEAQSALAARRGDWMSIFLSDAGSAAMLMNLQVPPGEPLPAPLDAATVLESARAGRATVSQVVSGAMLNRPRFAVRVPVLRDGKPRYVLSAAVDAATIARLVQRQAPPAGWAVAVLDGNFRFVTRFPEAAPASDLASESLKKALQAVAPGWQRGRLLDGTEIYRVVARSSLGEWSASMAVPRSVVEQGLWGVWLLCAGFAAAAALGLSIAWRLASRIAQPIAALAASAPALGRGDATALPAPGPVPEVRQLARALGEAAAAVREREERQRLAEQALRAADRAKDEFLAMLGHELRNPLASVANAAQLLRLSRHQPAVLDNVSDILGRQIEHMTRLVDDLLEVGRVTGGKVRLERAPLDLAAVAGELIDTWKSAERFLHHELSTELQPVWVSADRARIEQVVSNLLDNSLKYTPAGGAIRLAVRPQDGQALLEVADTGEGLPPELIGRIFDLFVQGERGLAREPGGLGIGLTLAKRLVELHGGTIRCSSAGPGRGATFSALFPAIEPAVADAGQRAGAAGRPPARRVLIVEDNRDARESLAALLRIAGHEVHAAESGVQGAEMAAQLQPELALVDIGLPDIDGYELVRRLRADPATRQLRVVALSGYGTHDDRRRALAAGFDEHLTKPADLGTLETLLGPQAAAA